MAGLRYREVESRPDQRETPLPVEFDWVGLVFLLVALGWWFPLPVRPDLLAGE